MFAEKIIQEWLTEIHYQSPVLIKKTHTSDKEIIKGTAGICQYADSDRHR